MTEPKIIESKAEFTEDLNAIKREQFIPQEFLDDLADSRLRSSTERMGDFVKVASIPAAVYEKWLREGYDVGKEPVTKTIAKLKAESLEAFLASTKRF
jgi:hypothetical protein